MIAHEGNSLPPWATSLNTLVSLWDMIQLRADGVLLVVRMLEKLSSIGKAIERAKQQGQTVSPDLSEERVKDFADSMVRIKGILEYLPVAAARKQIDRLSASFTQGSRLEAIYRDIDEALSRLQDELESMVFFIMPPGRGQLFSEPRNGWGAVSDEFPSAITDIEEASRCLALDRGSACVFHLMRVTEHGLVAVARGLSIPYAPSWESYLKQIDAELRQDWKDKDPVWKQAEEFYREVAAHLSTVKFAWRNPTMHIRRSYNTEEAEEVYNSVRSFMRHLATRLSESVP